MPYWNGLDALEANTRLRNSFSNYFSFLLPFYFHLKEWCESYLPACVFALAVFCHEAAWQTAWHMPRVKYQTVYTIFICMYICMDVEKYWERYWAKERDAVKMCSVCDTLERYITTKCVAHPTAPTNPFHAIMMIGAYLGKRACWFVCLLACQPALLVCLFVGLHTLHLTITSTLLSMSSRLENHFR